MKVVTLSNGYRISKNMGGIFLAQGSMFKKNFTSNEVTNNLDIKPLLCWILKIACDEASMDGDLDRISPYLEFPRSKKELSKFSNYLSNNYLFIIYVASMYILSVFSVFFISICNIYRIKHELYQQDV